MSNFALSSAAQSGFQNASHYDTHRPSYPAEAIDKLLTHLGVAGVEKAHLVDLGSGTGKFTELLARRDERYEIIAVEPHKHMREKCKQKNMSERVQVIDGYAEDIPIEQGWGDAIIAAQSFHWFANKESLKEIHRILKPGATFGMIWNVDEYNAPKDWNPTTKLDRKLKELVISTEDDHPRFRHMKWKEVFTEQHDDNHLQALVDPLTEDSHSFSLPLGKETIKWTVSLTEENLWSRFTTKSQIANLDVDVRKKIEQKVREALEDDGVKRNEKGEVALHGVTYLAWTSRV